MLLPKVLLLTHGVATDSGKLLLLMDTTLNAKRIREMRQFGQTAGVHPMIHTHSI